MPDRLPHPTAAAALDGIRCTRELMGTETSRFFTQDDPIDSLDSPACSNPQERSARNGGRGEERDGQAMKAEDKEEEEEEEENGEQIAIAWGWSRRGPEDYRIFGVGV